MTNMTNVFSFQKRVVFLVAIIFIIYSLQRYNLKTNPMFVIKKYRQIHHNCYSTVHTLPHNHKVAYCIPPHNYDIQIDCHHYYPSYLHTYSNRILFSPNVPVSS